VISLWDAIIRDHIVQLYLVLSILFLYLSVIFVWWLIKERFRTSPLFIVVTAWVIGSFIQQLLNGYARALTTIDPNEFFRFTSTPIWGGRLYINLFVASALAIIMTKRIIVRHRRCKGEGKQITHIKDDLTTAPGITTGIVRILKEYWKNGIIHDQDYALILASLSKLERLCREAYDKGAKEIKGNIGGEK